MPSGERRRILRKFGRFLAGGPGFEPRLTESESAVLPLNYPPPAKKISTQQEGGGLERGAHPVNTGAHVIIAFFISKIIPCLTGCLALRRSILHEIADS